MKTTQVVPWLAMAAGVIATPPPAAGKPARPPPSHGDYPTVPRADGPGGAPAGRVKVESKALQATIKQENIWATLQQLNTIAYANGGNRAFGLPGYAASVDFIYSEISKLGQFNVWKQDFQALFSRVESISLTVDGTPYYVTGLTYSPSTPAEGVTAPLVAAPEGNLSCDFDSYAGLDVAGKIVLVERGTCPDGTTFAGRMKPAAEAGAAAVIIYNSATVNLTAGTLSDPNSNFVSTGGINRDEGLALLARLQAGEAIEASFQQTQVIETRTTQNVFAETKYGDARNVVMLGAHLDSVQAGPGINDDGSGTALVLELARGMNKFTSDLKVRFAWWGAEENGLLGSKAYCNGLSADEADDVLTYLNFDMVSKGYYGVFDGDGSTHGVAAPAGSGAIEALFNEHFVAEGITVQPAVFTNGSDYASFWKILGKPVGGLHTGTGFAQDPCYHRACDSINNPNPVQITNNAKAAAHVLSVLSSTGVELLPRSADNSTMLLNRRDTIDWGYDLEALAFLEGTDERHLLTCGHEI
ncbi:aminopeptidase Y [Microdochium nivale]|nr:aminopeptidase Y [Microdochium nivale]